MQISIVSVLRKLFSEVRKLHLKKERKNTCVYSHTQEKCLSFFSGKHCALMLLVPSLGFPTTIKKIPRFRISVVFLKLKVKPTF